VTPLAVQGQGTIANEQAISHRLGFVAVGAGRAHVRAAQAERGVTVVLEAERGPRRRDMTPPAVGALLGEDELMHREPTPVHAKRPPPAGGSG